MVATHATKNRVRYRYYVSQPMLRGGTKLHCGSVTRVPAADIETVVSEALAKHLGNRTGMAGIPNALDRDVLLDTVTRIVVPQEPAGCPAQTTRRRWTFGSRHRAERHLETTAGSWLLIPWCKPPSRRKRERSCCRLLSPRDQVRPIKAERRATLVRAIARGRAWLDEIVSGQASRDRADCAREQVQPPSRQYDDLDGLYSPRPSSRLPSTVACRAASALPASEMHRPNGLGSSRASVFPNSS